MAALRRSLDERDGTAPVRDVGRRRSGGAALGAARVALPAWPHGCAQPAARARAHAAGQGTRLPRHPGMEEIIYVVSGRAEQWVDRESGELGPGDVAHIPKDVVHGTYNTGDETLVFLAILSPATYDGPALVDVAGEEPWRSLRPASART
ncbi:MAG TPA: cupin domain-containing protein [Vicinamibacterales bacterium]